MSKAIIGLFVLCISVFALTGYEMGWLKAAAIFTVSVTIGTFVYLVARQVSKAA